MSNQENCSDILIKSHSEKNKKELGGKLENRRRGKRGLAKSDGDRKKEVSTNKKCPYLEKVPT